jgi:hypothetical protein
MNKFKFLFKLLDNIKAGPKTSALGFILIISGIVSVFIGVSNWVVALFPILVGCYLVAKQK